MQRDVAGRRRPRRRGRARARPLAAARGLPRVRAARPAAPPGGGAGRRRRGRARAGRPRRRSARGCAQGTLARRRARCRADEAVAVAVAAARGARGRAVRARTRRGASASPRASEVLVGDAAGPGGAGRSPCGERPVVAHDAKALGAVPPNLAHDTLLGAYLLEPARRGFPFRELVRGARAGAPTSRTRPAATRCWSARWRRWQREQIARARARARSWTRSSCRSCACCATMELAGVRLNVERLAEITERVREEVATLEREIWDAGRRGVLDRLAPAARRDPVREARAVAQAPRQDRLLDRRARAAGDPRRARDHPARSSAGASSTSSSRPTSTCCPQLVDAASAHPHDVPAGGRARRAGWPRRTPTCRTSPCARQLGPRDPRLLRGRRRATC